MSGTDVAYLLGLTSRVGNRVGGQADVRARGQTDVGQCYMHLRPLACALQEILRDSIKGLLKGIHGIIIWRGAVVSIHITLYVHYVREEDSHLKGIHVPFFTYRYRFTSLVNAKTS